MTAVTPKERGILFCADMVRALPKEGRDTPNKTQTRRVLDLPPGFMPEATPRVGKIKTEHPRQGRFGVFVRDRSSLLDIVPCPYGQPGDILYVKETHFRHRHLGAASRVRYAADNMVRDRANPPIFSRAVTKEPKWIPSIFMPPWASRTRLTIAEIR